MEITLAKKYYTNFYWQIHSPQSAFYTLVEMYRLHNRAQYRNLMHTALHSAKLYCTVQNWNKPHFSRMNFSALHCTSHHCTSPHNTAAPLVTTQHCSALQCPVVGSTARLQHKVVVPPSIFRKTLPRAANIAPSPLRRQIYSL